MQKQYTSDSDTLLWSADSEQIFSEEMQRELEQSLEQSEAANRKLQEELALVESELSEKLAATENQLAEVSHDLVLVEKQHKDDQATAMQATSI